jgi:hypothetical protein
MDIHHLDPRVVRDEWNPVMKAGFNVDPSVLDDETKIVVKLKLLAPVRTRLRLFVDLTTLVENVLAHPPPNVVK